LTRLTQLPLSKDQTRKIKHKLRQNKQQHCNSAKPRESIICEREKIAAGEKRTAVGGMARARVGISPPPITNGWPAALTTSRRPRRAGRRSGSTLRCHRSTWPSAGATSARCRSVIDNQRHLAPSTGNIECFSPRKSIYVPLGVVRALSAWRRVEISWRVSFSLCASDCIYVSISLCLSLCVFYRSVLRPLIAAATASIKYSSSDGPYKLRVDWKMQDLEIEGLFNTL